MTVISTGIKYGVRSYASSGFVNSANIRNAPDGAEAVANKTNVQVDPKLSLHFGSVEYGDAKEVPYPTATTLITETHGSESDLWGDDPFLTVVRVNSIYFGIKLLVNDGTSWKYILTQEFSMNVPADATIVGYKAHATWRMQTSGGQFYIDAIGLEIFYTLPSPDHDIAVDPLTAQANITQPTLEQTHELKANLSSVTLTQTHALGTVELVASAGLTEPTLTQTHIINVDPLGMVANLTDIDFAQTHVIEIEPLWAYVELSDLTLAQYIRTPTPDCRRLRIGREDRRLTIHAEDRRLTIHAEDRRLTIHAEDRTLTIPREDRTLKIKCCD